MKKIVISNEKQYNKFLNKLWLYKSIFYKRTYFTIDNKINNINLDYINIALNIKNRKERINYIYNTCCDIIDNKFKGINICGFENSKCYIQRKINNNKCNGCCNKCLYQSNKGCTTKNLSCKLFNCTEVKSRYNVIEYNDLKILKLFSLKNRLLIKSEYFSKKEDVLKDLYSYSIIYATIRIIYRIVRNSIILNNKR